jgi:GDP-mannose 6-dehydrogenase
MKISVFGLGYVGTVCAACFAEMGHTVIGVDVNQGKVDLIRQGRSPIVEDRVGALIAGGVEKGLIQATTDEHQAVLDTDLSLICVGTPSDANGALDLTYVRGVAAHIGDALAAKDARHLVVMRSTVLPGTTDGVVLPILEERSGKTCGEGFGVAFNPEFLREATAVADFYDPPKTVIGAHSDADAERVAELYAGIDTGPFKTSLGVAEMVKYADNNFHALKVVFGNEIGAICKELGVDSHAVMDIFVTDTKLNLSQYYLKPGFAFGGSCLPKDVKALGQRAGELGVHVPMLASLVRSNELHIRRAVARVLALGRRKIGVLGFAFKAGTDDLRESPIVDLIEQLHGKGLELVIYDRNVNEARLVGANRIAFEKHAPHLATMMRGTIDEVIEHAEILVIGNRDPDFLPALERLSPEQFVYDLVRLAEHVECPARYEGIAW